MTELADTQPVIRNKKPRAYVLTDDEKELLIGAVERAKCLWQTKDPSYRNKDQRANSWWAINEELQGKNDQEWRYDAKTECEKLRETFSTTKRRLKTKSGQAATKEPTWKFFDLMQFLNTCTAGEESVFDSYEDEIPVGADAMDQSGNDENETPILDVEPVTLDDGSTIYLPAQQTSNDAGSVQDGDASSINSGFVTGPTGQPQRITPLRPLSAPSPNQNRASSATASVDAATPTGPKRTRLTPFPGRKLNKSPDENAELRKELLATVKDLKNFSEEDAFAHFIGQQLKSLPPLQKQNAMKDITDLMHRIRVQVLSNNTQ